MLTNRNHAAVEDAESALMDRLCCAFCGMLRERRGTELDKWLADIAGTGVPELQRYAKGLIVDKAAVTPLFNACLH